MNAAHRFDRSAPQHLLFVLLVTWVMLPSIPAHARSGDAGFRIISARTDLVEEVYRLDANIRYVLSKPVQEALDNGVPLILELQFQVLQDWWGLWDWEVASLSQRYRVQYHALSRQYLVENLNSGVQTNYASQEDALNALGTIRGLPVLDRRLLDSDQDYTARLRARLDIEALPTPLRVWAYLNSGWSLASNWYRWALHP